jgi:hypothetical protein
MLLAATLVKYYTRSLTVLRQTLGNTSKSRIIAHALHTDSRAAR